MIEYTRLPAEPESKQTILPLRHEGVQDSTCTFVSSKPCTCVTFNADADKGIAKVTESQAKSSVSPRENYFYKASGHA